MLLNDAYAGHRKWWRKGWVENPSLVSVWTEWDFILLRVAQYVEDYTNANGLLVWVDEDPDVWWDVNKSFSTYERDTHEFRENNDVKQWEGLRAVPRWGDDVEAPSMEKWLKQMEDGPQEHDGRPQGSRPPTPEELAALMRANSQT